MPRVLRDINSRTIQSFRVMSNKKRIKKEWHSDYINVNQLIDYLSKYKDKHVHYEDFLFGFFSALNYSFHFRYETDKQDIYELESSDVILFYAIKYHVLENNSRLLYSRGWYKNLFAWWQSWHYGTWKPKEISYKTLDSRIKRYDKPIGKKPKKINKNTRVYLMIDNHTGLYKIGRSIKPLKREKTLQSEKPSIKLLYDWEAVNKDEHTLHKIFKRKRVRGEWFDLNDIDISSIKNYFQEKHEQLK